MKKTKLRELIAERNKPVEKKEEKKKYVKSDSE